MQEFLILKISGKERESIPQWLILPTEADFLLKIMFQREPKFSHFYGAENSLGSMNFSMVSQRRETAWKWKAARWKTRNLLQVTTLLKTVKNMFLQLSLTIIKVQTWATRCTKCWMYWNNKHEETEFFFENKQLGPLYPFYRNCFRHCALFRVSD